MRALASTRGCGPSVSTSNRRKEGRGLAARGRKWRGSPHAVGNISSGGYTRGSFDDDGWSDESGGRGSFDEMSSSSPVGAEYGDTGFVDFRFSGDVRLDVEQLNERLEVKGAARMRHSGIAPDEAHGLIFTWDGVITDTREVQRAAWQELAAEEDFKWPEIERPFIFESNPERAITEVLRWTRDFAYARRLAFRMNEIYYEKFESINKPLPGIKDWLETLNQFGIPIAVVSTMSRDAITGALDRLEMSQIFDALVTAEDDMDTYASQLLSASIKLARPPKKCVAFTSSPMMLTAAHNCTMKAVGVVGQYKHFDLNHADLTCSHMSELSLINVRRLFALDGDNFMDLQKQRTAAQPGSIQTGIGTFGPR